MCMGGCVRVDVVSQVTRNKLFTLQYNRNSLYAQLSLSSLKSKEVLDAAYNTNVCIAYVHLYRLSGLVVMLAKASTSRVFWTLTCEFGRQYVICRPCRHVSIVVYAHTYHTSMHTDE